MRRRRGALLFRDKLQHPIGQGTTFEGKHLAFGDATWRLVEYDRPHHLVIEGFVGTAPYRYVGDFRATNGGTLFRGRVEWDPRGVWRSLGLLLHPLLKLRTRRSFRNLRVALERSSPVGRGWRTDDGLRPSNTRIQQTRRLGLRLDQIIGAGPLD